MRNSRLLFLLFLVVSIAAYADENPRRTPPIREIAQRHFVIETEHVLRPFEVSELQARGIEIQHVLPGNRYLVRAADTGQIESDPNVKTVAAYGASRKIDLSAIHEASGRAFSRVRLIFHDDVAFADARAAVEAIGGGLDHPMMTGFQMPNQLIARIPSTALQTLAADERVFAIYGPPLHPVSLNSVAAGLSHVTPLYSPPYGLSGNGVVLSEFELALADVGHPEFGGRLIPHITGGAAEDALHATHVAGTIMAQGIDPLAKGMSPQAMQLLEFDANSPTLLPGDKQNLASFNVIADNNSWGFELGWQIDPSTSMYAWFDSIEYFGGYDAAFSAPYDQIAHDGPVLFVHSAGNDGDSGNPPLQASNAFGHEHTDDQGNIIKGEVFCYSKDKSGTDCPTPFCSTPLSTHCENTAALPEHPTYGPFLTMGVLSSTKNAIAVGAVDSQGNIASFSSRGPTVDGRVKPDVVAMGVGQYSSEPTNTYGFLSGTSMSSPVVTGICGLLTEQWRKTFGGQNPTPQILKTLLIAGADDLGNPGPDYTFGFGLVDAQRSVDLIIADNNSGARIRGDNISQGQQVDIPMTLATQQNVRVVLGWADPATALPPATDTTDPLATKTLVNELALQVTGPSGTAMPYVLDPNNPSANATTGVNTTDNVLEVEIANAPVGNYDVLINGTSIASGPTQRWVLIANAPLGLAFRCGDIYKPNNTSTTAFGPLASGTTIGAKLCSAGDLGFFKMNPNAAGPLSVTVNASDTPLQVTLSGNGITPVVASVAAGSSGTVTTPVTTSGTYIVEVAAAGTLGANATYKLTPAYSFVIPARRRAAHH